MKNSNSAGILNGILGAVKSKIINCGAALLFIGTALTAGSAFAQTAPDLSARDAHARIGMSCILMDKKGVPDELMKAYWGNIHGVLGTRHLGVDTYWEHWLGAPLPNFFSTIAGVDQKFPDGAPINGLAEISFRTMEEVAKLKISPSVPLLQQDEQNIFGESYMYATLPGNTVTVIDRSKTNVTEGKPEGYSVIVFVRRSVAVSTEQFRSFLRNDFAGTLAKSADVLKVRYQLYQPYDTSLWPTPNVEHARTADQVYAGYLELSFTSMKGAEHFIKSAEFKALAPGFSANVAAMNTYPNEETYTMIIDGVATTAGLRGIAAAKVMTRLGDPENERTLPVLKVIYGQNVKAPLQ
jgi:hypothetical protein